MPRSGGFPSISPGQRLYQWILSRYTSQMVGPARPFWISTMSREFGVADLEEYLLHSTAMMMVRRLLANARWYDERSFDREDALRRFERDYLPSAYSLDRSSRQRLADLVF